MVLVGAVAGLGVYFVLVGLENADKMASVVGVFVALVGLGLTVYGMWGQARTQNVVNSDRVGQTVQADRIENITFGSPPDAG